MHQFLTQLDDAWKTGYEFVKGSPVVLKRSDINSVMSNSGTIMNDRRIREALATTVELRQTGAAAIADAAHQSRKGMADFYPTLQHSQVMNQILKEEYPDNYDEWEYIFSETCWGLTQFGYLSSGRNVLSNNIRFAPWELRVPPHLYDSPPARLVEKLRDAGHRVCYVQDASPSAHRGGQNKDTSLYALPLFFKQRGIPVFPSRHFAEEMMLYAKLNEMIHQSKKVIVALFGGKVTDYLDVIALYQRRDNIEFLAGSLLSMVLMKSKHPEMNYGVNEDRFFKDIGAPELAKFEKLYDADRMHIAHDLIITTPDEIVTRELTPETKIRYEVQGIGPQTVKLYADIVKGAQLLMVNGCPFNIRRFETFGGTFQDFMTQVRKQNGSLKIYDCGGDAITAIEFTGVKTDISSTAGKLGLLAPMIENMDDLQKNAPAVVPLL
ncbi:MAG: phosphoglycerate kinase [Candidatus Hodarchaeota archaeon]